MKIEIACPNCRWKPDGNAHWECSCGYIWDTFSTAGRCPACAKVWQETACPGNFLLGIRIPFNDPGGCGKWSPHLDWYRNLDQLANEEFQAASQNLPDSRPRH